MSDLVLRNDAAGVATLTLNRPDKLNALNVAVFEALDAHRAAIAEDESVRLVILRGAGRCFSAGHDLGDIVEREVLPEPNFQAKAIERLAALPQPLIVAVHGHCYTGALELALAADLIVASHAARFADTHARWALMPVWGLSQRLPRRIGDAKAREMMLTCRTYTGLEAEAMGLANFCWPDAEFDTRLQALGAEILANSTHTHRGLKRLLAKTEGLPLPAGLACEIYDGAGTGPDMKARIEAFLNRPKKSGA